MNNKFISSTMILVLGGFITKIFGFIIKIAYTRVLTEEGIGLYAIIQPTYSLLITIAVMALPLAISKLTSEGKNTKNLIASSVVIIILVNIFLITVMLVLSKYIAFNLLKNSDTYYIILASTLTLPFISISSIIKGYFLGKQKMIPIIIANFGEQVIRLLLIVLVLPYFIKLGLVMGVSVFILFNIISEISSILIFLLFMQRKTLIKVKELKPDLKSIKEVLSVSIPTVSSRFIGNIGFFLEPIILINVLILVGYTSDYITLEYGVYNNYTIGLLSAPSFLVGALSSSLIPEISKFFSKGNIKMVKKRFLEAIFFSFVLGIFLTLFIYLYRNQLLNILYHSNKGADYIKVLSLVFPLFYLESPIISTLQALGKSGYTMRVTLIGVVIKNIVLAITSLFRIGIYSLVIAEMVNIIIVVGANILKIKKLLF